MLLHGSICSASLGKIATYIYPGSIVERSMQSSERMPLYRKKYGGLVIAFWKSITGYVCISAEKKKEQTNSTNSMYGQIHTEEH